METGHWILFAGVAFLVVANLFIYSLFRTSRDERRFNEFLVCLVLYELGNDDESSMPLGMLRHILPCHPDEADELIAHLEGEQLVEIYLDDNAPRARLGARPYLLLESGNWRRAFQPDVHQRFELALASARSKLTDQFGTRRAA